MKNLLSSAISASIVMLCALCLCLQSAPSAAAGEIREILRNRGFNHPEDKTAEWNLRTGGLGSFSLTADPDSPDNSNVLSAKVTQISAKPWSMELLQRLGTAVTSNSVLKLSFDYKITPGYVFHFYWQVEASPWPKLLSLRINEPAGEWHHLSVTVPVHEGYAADTTALSFHLAETLGELQLKNLSVLLLPPGTDPRKIPSTVPPVLGGDFYDKDWRESILDKISKNRTSILPISVRSQGKPVPGAEILCTQLKNDLQIGAEASGALLQPQILTEHALRELRSQISPRQALLPKYRKNLLQPRKFDFISIYDAFIWKEYDLWGRKIGEPLLKDLREAGLRTCLPAMFIPAFMHAPTSCRNMSAEKLWSALFAHLSRMARTYSPLADSLGVVHGPIKYSEIYHFIGVECLPEAFLQVRRNAPRTPCYISAPDALGDLSSTSLNDLLELINWLRSEHAVIDGVILQANFHELNVAPQTMEKRLDRFAGKVQLPIHIRNFAVNEEKDDVHADMVRDFLLLFYAEPRVASLSLGEQWSAALLNPRLGYYTADFQPRAAAAVLDRYLFKEWRSSRKAVSDQQGQCSVSLYHGQYCIQVTCRKQQFKKIIHTRDLSQDKPLIFDIP